MLLQRDGRFHLPSPGASLDLPVQRGVGAHSWVMESAGLGVKTLPKHSQPPGPPPSITLDPTPNIHHPQEPSLHPPDALQTHSKSPSSPEIPQPALLSLRSNRNPIFHVKISFPCKHFPLPALSSLGILGAMELLLPLGIRGSMAHGNAPQDIYGHKWKSFPRIYMKQKHGGVQSPGN